VAESSLGMSYSGKHCVNICISVGTIVGNRLFSLCHSLIDSHFGDLLKVVADLEGSFLFCSWKSVILSTSECSKRV
jgi:hypothetical protein